MRLLPALLVALLFSAGCSAPPQKEIDMAQGAIDAARAAGAEQYAADAYRQATTALQQAHDAVGQRDYRLALTRALDAHDRAQTAAKGAADGKARARSEADQAITAAAGAHTRLDTEIRNAEAARVPRRDIAAAGRQGAAVEKALQEARAAVEAGDYARARAIVKDVPAQVDAAITALTASTAKARPPRGGRRTR